MDDGDVELVVLAEVVGAEHDVLGPQGEEGGQPLLDADHLLHTCFVKPLPFVFFRECYTAEETTTSYCFSVFLGRPMCPVAVEPVVSKE